MLGTMMNYPLTLSALFERTAAYFGLRDIVSRRSDCSLHRYRYADFIRRARALAEALTRAGLKRGERVATLSWNHYAHLEAYFGVPIAGGVLHTLNLRLHPQQLAWIARDGGDRFLIVDDLLLPLLEQFREHAPFERIFVVPLTGQPVPDSAESYETLLETPTGPLGECD